MSCALDNLTYLLQKCDSKMVNEIQKISAKIRTSIYSCLEFAPLVPKRRSSQFHHQKPEITEIKHPLNLCFTFCQHLLWANTSWISVFLAEHRCWEKDLNILVQ